MSQEDKAYIQAVDEFINKMEHIRGYKDPLIGEAIENVALQLRAGRVSVRVYEDIKLQRELGKMHIYYADGEADEERMIMRQEAADGGFVLQYMVFQRKGDENWSEEEEERVESVLGLLHILLGRMHGLAAIEFMTYRDRDLGIYNLNYLLKQAEIYIEQGKIGEYAACYFNLKSFSAVNKQIGRDKATEVMKKYIVQMQQMLPEGDIVSRIGGDNFAVLFHKEYLGAVMEYLKGKAIEYDAESGEKILIAASAGYYMIPEDCRAATDIMDSVSMAHSTAQKITKEPYVFYNEDLMQRLKEMKRLDNLFPDAIQNEEFKVYYQPKVELKNYRLAGAEALCRWVHNGEMLQPGNFIPVFEQSKAICALDFYMLDHVCQDIRKWLDEGRQVVRVSVNLSRCHLGDMELLDHLLEIIDRHQVPHEYIEIELTETTTDADYKDLKRIVTGLQQVGISTSVDDFGIGYSSLTVLRELPWKVLKIDKGFLWNRDNDNTQSRIMLKHIIAMAQELGLKCIVEGVETMEHVKLLKENNCFMAQGFYFDKPLPREEFERRLMEQDK